MPKDIVYLYVDGSDLYESEASLTDAFAMLASEWKGPPLLFVNDKQPPNPEDLPEDLPEWTLGLNINANTLIENDIDSLLRFAKVLAEQTGCDFVFGLADQQMHVSEDMCFIDAGAGEMERLIMLAAIAKN